MAREHSHPLVLSVYPSSRGFAFVLFEGPESPFDWGVKEIRGAFKNAATVDEIKKLINRYRPEVLAIEETGQHSQRTARIRRLYRMFAHVADAQYVKLHRCSMTDVRKNFAGVGARTKYEIAQAIAAQIPAFAHRMPRIRKAWMSEDSRQSLFDAAALGLTYYARGTPSPNMDDISS